MKDYRLDRSEHLAALSLKMGFLVVSDIQGAEILSAFDDYIVFEGNPYRHLAIRYERSRLARRECINVHGNACAICGFQFGSAYGEKMENLILVHHLKMISTSGGCRAIDPSRDMRPICANCNYVIHRRKPPYIIEEVKNMLISRG